MKKTILLLWALLSAYAAPAQGARAQTHAEGAAESNLQGQSTAPIRVKSLNGSATWHMKKKHVNEGQYCYHPGISNEYTSIHPGVINHFFNKSLIVPSPSTAHLLMNHPVQNSVVAVQNTHPEASVASSGEKLFSNDQVTFSSIYPNPANSGYAFIDYTLSPEVRDAKVVLYNVLGTPVSEFPLDRNETKLRISTLALESGFYYYTFFIDSKSLVTRRLVVKH